MRTLALVGVLIASLALWASPTEGATITAGYDTGMAGCSGSVSDLDYRGGEPLSFGPTCGTMPWDGQVGFLARASLTTVRLGLNLTDSPYGASAWITISDTITVGGGTGIGYLEFAWAVDGILVADDQLHSVFQITANNDYYPFARYEACGAEYYAAAQCQQPVGAAVPVHDAPPRGFFFVFGTPLTVEWTFAAAIAGCPWIGPCLWVDQPFVGVVDFSNTARLQPLVVLDGSGSAVEGASVVSDGGFSYEVAGTGPTPVPEPASLLLLGAGLAALARWRKQRR